MNNLLQGNQQFPEKTYFQRIVATQIAFDLEDLADQNLTSSVADKLCVREEHRNDIEYTAQLVKVKDILYGTVTMNLYLKFLNSKNKTDMQILTDIKSEFDPKVSMNLVGTF